MTTSLNKSVIKIVPLNEHSGASGWIMFSTGNYVQFVHALLIMSAVHTVHQIFAILHHITCFYMYTPEYF